jgi:flagellar motor switch protein FliN/FliY
MGEELEYTPLEASAAAPAPSPGTAGDLRVLRDVPVELAVEIGRTQMTIGETLELGPGSIVTLARQAGAPVDLLVNGRTIARGEVVVIDEEFGLRITDVVSRASRLDAGATPAPAPAPADAVTRGAAETGL